MSEKRSKKQLVAAESDNTSAVSVSVVSHGHAGMLPPLLARLLEAPEVAEVILTSNNGENLASLMTHPRIQLIQNTSPKGFGENHNAAFRRSVGTYFCPLNPDVLWEENPFPALLAELAVLDPVILAPMVLDIEGRLEDSARRFPTLPSLVRKAMKGDRGAYSLELGGGAATVDWVAGMFMIASRAVYARLDGFDEHYRLYYEDVDLCARAWQSGIPVMVAPSVAVTHDAQRASRRHPVYFAYHALSLLRYLWRHAWRLPKAAPG